MTLDSVSSAKVEAAVQEAILWLEDDPMEDRVQIRKAEVERLGYKVVIAKGFRELERRFRERLPGEAFANERVRLLVVDIMITGVNNLSAYFPWVSDARSANGFAAGLVFLERVFSPERRSPQDRVFGSFEELPLIIYSNRAVPPDEMPRLQRVEERRKGRVAILEKAATDRLVQTIKDLLSPAAAQRPS